MNICFITSSFPRRYPDNIAPWFHETAVGLARSGHNLSVFAPAHRGGRQHEYFGARVYRFRYAPASWERLTHEDSATANLKNPAWKLTLLAFMLSGSVQAVIYFLRNRRFDVIDVHWPFPLGLFGVIGKLLSGSRLVFHFYASEVLLVRDSALLRGALKAMLWFADDVIAISNPTKKLVEEVLRPRQPVKVVYYGSQIPAVTTAEGTVPDFTREPLRLLFAGKLIERKGARYLLDAVKVLKDRGVEVRLSLVGEGYLRPEIEAQVSRLGLVPEVELKGFISKDALISEYRSCHIFVFPSIVDSLGDTEGLGLAPLEAIFSGRPAIASAVGGVTDIVIEGRTGYLVPQKDSGALAEKLLLVRNNYPAALDLTRSGAAYLRTIFSWDAVLAGLISVYGGEHA